MGDLHLLPMTEEWLGFTLRHGERDDLDPDHPSACLCGFPYYLHCPGWMDDDTVRGLTLYPAEHEEDS